MDCPSLEGMTRKRAYLSFNVFGLLGKTYETEELTRLSPQMPVTYCCPKCNLPALADLVAGSASARAAPCFFSCKTRGWPDVW